MKESKVLRGLCYISILFAPFLFPLFVWLVSKEGDVKETAVKAFKLHLVPVGLTLFAIVLTAILSGISDGSQITGTTNGLIWIIIGAVDFALLIYNLVLGIRIFKD